jgi:alpha-tubulin suppressor-like RCC1 family protein
LTTNGLLWRWTTSLDGALNGHATLPRPVARADGGSDAMRFAAVSCGGEMTLAVTLSGAVVRVGKESEGVAPARRAGLARGAEHDDSDDDDDDDEEEEWRDDDDEARANASTAAAEGGVGRLLLAQHVPLPAAVRIASVSCGDAHRLLLSVGGTVYAYGLGAHGRLGVGGERSHATPQCVTALAASSVVSIAAGAYHSAAVLADGSVATWGHGKYGQLGHGVQQGQSNALVL